LVVLVDWLAGFGIDIPAFDPITGLTVERVELDLFALADGRRHGHWQVTSESFKKPFQ
jgi:hypothetical protein